MTMDSGYQAPAAVKGWRQRLRPTRLYTRIAWLGALTLAAAIALLTWQIVRDQTELGREALESEARALAGSLAAGTAALLVTERYSEIEQLLLRNAHFPHVLRLQAASREGRILAHVVRVPGAEPAPRFERTVLAPPQAAHGHTGYESGNLVVWQPVEAGVPLGWIRLEYRLDYLHEIRARLLRHGALAALAAVAAATLLFLVVLRRPMRALRRATDFAANLDRHLGEPYRADRDALEIEQLGEALDAVSQRLARQEQTIAATGEHLSAVLQHAIDGIVTLNERGRVESANPAAERLFRAHSGRLTGMRFALLVPDLPLGLDELEDGDPPPAPGKKGIRIKCEAAARRLDGTECPVMIGATHMMLKKRSAFVVIVRDISEQKGLERMKENFIASVSHELRTPLTAMHGSLGLLAAEIDQVHGDARALIEIAHKNSARLVRLVNDILDFRDIESGEVEFDMKVHELAPLLHELMQANDKAAKQLGVTLELLIADDALHVWIDRSRFLQAVQKLLDNAIKLSSGGAAVRVVAERRDSRVRLSVTDRGPGIPEEFRRYLFQKFVQVDAEDIRYRAGAGMGLSIARAIVERMGGRLDYRSDASATTFFVELPEAEGKRAARVS
jgi:PAS domain S-box-containing protein